MFVNALCRGSLTRHPFTNVSHHVIILPYTNPYSYSALPHTYTLLMDFLTRRHEWSLGGRQYQKNVNWIKLRSTFEGAENLAIVILMTAKLSSNILESLQCCAMHQTFGRLAMMIYFKALEGICRAAFCPFIPKLPLTVPKSTIKSAKKMLCDYEFCSMWGVQICTGL